ncbi:MAG: asparagine synthase-related protein [Candidatus Wallbacteria bacterium]|nr:asparagine synthase-related protein [Candidatus Wallbacteria bacterium]
MNGFLNFADRSYKLTGRKDYGEVSIIFSGELYNKIEISKQFDRDVSVEELVFRLYQKHKEKFIAGFDGDFNLVLFDRGCDRIFLFQDLTALTPLLYHFDGYKLIFGHDYSYFRSHLPIQIDYEGLSSYLRFEYFKEGQTMLKGVRLIPPGHYLEVSQSGCRLFCYYKPAPAAPVRSINEAAESLRDLAVHALKKRLHTGSLDLMYSGGLDSSALLAAADLAGISTRTFSLRFSEPGFDEGTYRYEMLSGRIEHQEFLVTLKNYAEELQKLIVSGVQGCAFGQDHAAFLSAISAFCLNSSLFFGLPADEWFFGYPFMSSAVIAKRRVNQVSALFSAGIPDNPDRPGIVRHLKMEFLPVLRHHTDYLVRRLSDQEIIELMGVEYLSPDPETLPDNPEEFFRSLILFQYKNSLPGNNYLKLHSIGTLSGNKIQLPFSDLSILEFALSLPFELAVSERQRKFILSRAFPEIPAIIRSRRKQGFQIPLNAWIRSRELSFIREYLHDHAVTLKIPHDMIERFYTDTVKPEESAEKIWMLFAALLMVNSLK